MLVSCFGVIFLDLSSAKMDSNWVSGSCFSVICQLNSIKIYTQLVLQACFSVIWDLSFVDVGSNRVVGSSFNGIWGLNLLNIHTKRSWEVVLGLVGCWIHYKLTLNGFWTLDKLFGDILKLNSIKTDSNRVSGGYFGVIWELNSLQIYTRRVLGDLKSRIHNYL